MADTFVNVADIENKVKEITSRMIHKHYCENDVESVISIFDDRFSWIGAGENEYALGAETVKDIFRKFSGRVPRCNISDEQYDVLRITDEVYLCTGRIWISTDPSTNAYLRVHQRITLLFRLNDRMPYCCHIHISNPYVEMDSSDVGFPTKLARQSYEYLQECVEQQSRQIREQTKELSSIYNTVPCAIMRFRKTDKGCKILSCNPAAANMLGYEREQVEQLKWEDGICSNVLENDVPKLREALKTLKKAGDLVDITYRIRHSSGKIVYVNSSNLCISEDGEGQVIQRIAYDITDRVEIEETLKRKSYEDALTGLFNRNKLNKEIESGAYSGVSELGIVYFDINGLKCVNDHCGHSAGDELIYRAARHIAHVFYEKAYRIGGDEFAAIIYGISEKEFIKYVEDVCRNAKKDGIDISAGYSWRETGCNLKEQFEEADKSMYINKQRFYSDSKNDRRKQR